MKASSQEKHHEVNCSSNQLKMLHGPLLKCNFYHFLYRRDLVVAAQNFLCAGCGTPIEPSKYGS